MSQSVQFERRLFASVTALAAALPIVLALLPEYVSDATPVIIAAALALIVCAAPIPRVIRVVSWGGVMVLLAPMAVALSGPESAAILVLVPMGLITLTSRPVLGSVGLVIAAGVTVALLGPTSTQQLRAFSGGTLPDLIGRVAFVGWALGTVAVAVRLTRAKHTSMNQAATAHAVDEAIARDCGSLEKITAIVADPSLAGPVLNAGLGEHDLGLAVRIDKRRVLLGWLEGPPLATVSAGWALAARARAGQHSPRGLLRFARERLDEMLPGNAFRWLAVWDRSTGVLDASVVVPAEPMLRCALTDRGPRSSAKANPRDSAATIATLLPSVDPFETAGGPPTAHVVGAGLCVAAVVASFLPLPVIVLPLFMAALIGGHSLVHRARRESAEALADSREQIRDRAELHDDLRFQIARLHGGLLQYQMEFGNCRATAHRLRGEVLEGSFADLVLDPEDRGHILAGEVAGRGIAARFLGLAAQMVAHHQVSSGRADPQELDAIVSREVKRLGKRLGFPARLRLGAVTIDASGSCEGSGVLRRLVVVRGTAERSRVIPLAPAEIASIAPTALLNDDTRVYLSPSAAVPGPEDEAPALGTSAASERIESLLRGGEWHPRDSTLPSLFSLVFDGRRAPAHGTLIELALLSGLQSEDDDDADHQSPQDQGSGAPHVAAI